MPQPIAHRVALIGWDAADWKIITPLMDRGKMPHLRKLVERGVMGGISTLDPALSPILWTSIATGKTGDQHGILGFLEPDPVGGGVRPVSSSSRRSSALWNILDREGLRSLVVNWFASQPAEKIAGACVSNAFPKPTARQYAPWPLVPDSVHPAAYEEALSELRLHPGDLSGDDLLPFIPKLATIDQETDRRPLALGALLAEAIGTHGAATWLMEKEPWNFLAVYFDAIDRAGHIFMRYHAPRMESVTERDFELYKDVINGIYCFQDMMLGRVVELAGPEAHIVVLSDHGFESGRFRPKEALGAESDNPLQWHRSHGVFCIAGPGIRKDELVYGASLLDITPTILTLFGLPVGADMPGRVLSEAFEHPPEALRIPTWEKPATDEAAGAPLEEQSVWDASAVLEQLAALGYIDTVGKDSDEKRKAVKVDRDFNLVKIHMSAARYADAIPLLEELIRDAQPARKSALQLHLAHCLSREGRVQACRELLSEILAENENKPSAHIIRGNLALVEGDVETGLAHLKKAEEALGETPHVQILIGKAYLRAKMWKEAERSFRNVIEFDADSAESHCGLAQSLLEQGFPRKSAEAALAGIGLKFDMALAHYTLGVALARLRRFDRAVTAFETCVALAPGAVEAEEWLKRIRSRRSPRVKSRPSVPQTV